MKSDQSKALIWRSSLLSAFLLLSGCASMHQQTGIDSRAATYAAHPVKMYEAIPQSAINTEPRRVLAEGIRLLDAGEYVEASEHFNLAVKMDITNSWYQFFNALAYHLRGLQGESALMPLAETGYGMAIQFDENNHLAQYYLGLLHLDQRRYGLAAAQFGKAAMYDGGDSQVLYNLALASYYNRDLKTAAAALEGIMDNDPGAMQDPKILRAAAVVSAATGNHERAQAMLAAHNNVETSETRRAHLAGRVATWRDAGNRSDVLPPVVLAQTPRQLPAAGSDRGFPFAAAGNTTPGNKEDSFVDNEMVIVDVVIIRTEEDSNSSVGVNLLQGLQMQFGNPLDGTPGFSEGYARVTDQANAFNNVNQRSLTRFISIPAVAYSLNIANANTARNEVLARPSLVALSGETSNFFSGVDITGAAVSGGDGDSVSVEKQVGVKLAITPEFLPNQQVKLSIQAERTFLTNPSANVVFDFRLDTTKTIVNANVVMSFGETLILSGLSEREQSNLRDGVPGLQDIPFLQYGFSRKTTRDFLKSVLILVTPRHAQYTYRPETVVEKSLSEMTPDERAMAEFEARYNDWFQPHSNMAPVFRQMRDNTLYREFREGDLSMESWNSRQSHWTRLKEAITFIYY